MAISTPCLLTQTPPFPPPAEARGLHGGFFRRDTVITHFDSSFAGHIDMDNVGYQGTPVNDRWFSNEALVTVFDKAEAIATTLDRLGYDRFWMAEHHFQPEGYECIPNLLLYAVHLAHVTERIKIGCGFNITPMWHPLRLAEDYAVADIVTGGLVIFGVGRGYQTREVEIFGAPLLDQPANRDLFEEQVDIIFKAFNDESFSHQGTYYTLPPRVPYRGYELTELTLVPRPLRRPVECWQPIQSATARGLDFMARHGIKGVVGGGSADGGARPSRSSSSSCSWRKPTLAWSALTWPIRWGRRKVSFWNSCSSLPKKSCRLSRIESQRQW